MPASDKGAELDITDELIAESRGIGNLPDDMAPWMAAVIGRIDRFNHRLAIAICWLVVPIFLAMGYEVFMRHFLNAPTLWAYDVSRMFSGALFMLGAAYGLLKGVHIRADFIYRNWQASTQAKVDAFLYIVFFFPGMFLFLIAASDYAFTAWIRGELGMDTAWMPHMGPIKSVLPVGIVLLVIQGISELLKCAYTIKHNRWP